MLADGPFAAEQDGPAAGLPETTPISSSGVVWGVSEKDSQRGFDGSQGSHQVRGHVRPGFRCRKVG